MKSWNQMGLRLQISIGILASLLIGILYLLLEHFSGIRGTSLPMSVVAKKETTKMYTISAEYPRFSGLSIITDEIQKAVDVRIDDFKKTAEENWRLRLQNASPGEQVPQFPADPFPFTLTWNPKQVNESVISLVILASAYTGGANEEEDIIAFNFDVKKKKMMTLSDLFLQKPDYLTTISEFCRADIVTRLTAASAPGETVSEDIVMEGTVPVEENFKRFTFDDTNIVFYFPKGTVAPAVYGTQSVIMNRKSFGL